MKVCVKMKNLENGTEFIWPKEKFLNRWIPNYFLSDIIEYFAAGKQFREPLDPGRVLLILSVPIGFVGSWELPGVCRSFLTC